MRMGSGMMGSGTMSGTKSVDKIKMSQLSAKPSGETVDLPLFSQLGHNQHRPGGK